MLCSDFKTLQLDNNISIREQINDSTPDEYVLLQLPGSAPVLRTFRVVYSDNRLPVEATVMVKAGHLYELQYWTEIPEVT